MSMLNKGTQKIIEIYIETVKRKIVAAGWDLGQSFQLITYDNGFK